MVLERKAGEGRSGRGSTLGVATGGTSFGSRRWLVFRPNCCWSCCCSCPSCCCCWYLLLVSPECGSMRKATTLNRVEAERRQMLQLGSRRDNVSSGVTRAVLRAHPSIDFKRSGNERADRLLQRVFDVVWTGRADGAERRGWSRKRRMHRLQRMPWTSALLVLSARHHDPDLPLSLSSPRMIAGQTDHGHCLSRFVLFSSSTSCLRKLARMDARLWVTQRARQSRLDAYSQFS